jgi:hypothetical protein
MKRTLIIAALLTAGLSAWGQTINHFVTAKRMVEYCRGEHGDDMEMFCIGLVDGANRASVRSGPEGICAGPELSNAAIALAAADHLAAALKRDPELDKTVPGDVAIVRAQREMYPCK